MRRLLHLALTAAIVLLSFSASGALAQDTEKAETPKEEKKDPNAKPDIPENAAVDATVWGAVVYASNSKEKHKAPKQLPDLTKRLGKIRGFSDFKSFEVIGQHTQKVFSEYTNWVVPSKELFLNIDSKGPAGETEADGINLHVQLWRRANVLVKTDTTLKKGSPLIIGGPKWRDGQLIFVLLLK